MMLLIADKAVISQTLPVFNQSKGGLVEHIKRYVFAGLKAITQQHADTHPINNPQTGRSITPCHITEINISSPTDAPVMDFLAGWATPVTDFSYIKGPCSQ